MTMHVRYSPPTSTLLLEKNCAVAIWARCLTTYVEAPWLVIIYIPLFSNSRSILNHFIFQGVMETSVCSNWVLALTLCSSQHNRFHLRCGHLFTVKTSKLFCRRQLLSSISMNVQSVLGLEEFLWRSPSVSGWFLEMRECLDCETIWWKSTI